LYAQMAGSEYVRINQYVSAAYCWRYDFSMSDGVVDIFMEMQMVRILQPDI
jgi:hypothetical protein